VPIRAWNGNGLLPVIFKISPPLNSRFHYTSLFALLLVLHVIAGVWFNGYSFWWIIICVLAYISVLAAGSFFIRWNFYMRSLNKLPLLRVGFQNAQFQVAHRGKEVALTFDDGPAAPTAIILDILAREKVKATFFLIGKNIADNESLVKRMADEGHTLGNHSFSHSVNFDWKSAAAMQQELEQTNSAIEAVTGIPVKLFRPPYGVTNPNLAKAVAHCGMRSIGWNLRSMDTVARDEAKLLRKILRMVRPGGIILLHDRCPITANILPALLQEFKKRGYTFATL
jgi:peptidoglycan/xylan/chitin deacetylase (PgdA/CDA1 family)